MSIGQYIYTAAFSMIETIWRGEWVQVKTIIEFWEKSFESADCFVAIEILGLRFPLLLAMTVQMAGDCFVADDTL